MQFLAGGASYTKEKSINANRKSWTSISFISFFFFFEQNATKKNQLG